jgi:hypothetical protein
VEEKRALCFQERVSPMAPSSSFASLPSKDLKACRVLSLMVLRYVRDKHGLPGTICHGSQLEGTAAVLPPLYPAPCIRPPMVEYHPCFSNDT